MDIGAHVEQTDPIAEAKARKAPLVQFFLGDPQSYKGPVVAYEGGAAKLKADGYCTFALDYGRRDSVRFQTKLSGGADACTVASGVAEEEADAVRRSKSGRARRSGFIGQHLPTPRGSGPKTCLARSLVWKPPAKASATR